MPTAIAISRMDVSVKPLREKRSNAACAILCLVLVVLVSIYTYLSKEGMRYPSVKVYCSWTYTIPPLL